MGILARIFGLERAETSSIIQAQASETGQGVDVARASAMGNKQVSGNTTLGCPNCGGKGCSSCAGGSS